MMDMELVRDAKTIAEEIREIKAEVRATAVRGAIEIGKRLKECKSLVPYGEWGRWLEENVEYSERTAQDLMRIADEYGKKESQAIADISYTQAVKLLALPAEEREQFVAEHDMEALSTRELQAEIIRLKEQNEKKQLTIEDLMQNAQEARALDSEEAAKRAEELEDELKQAKEQMKLAERQRDSDVKAEQAKNVKEREAREKAQKERKAAQEALAASELKLKRMEDALKEANEKVRTVEVTPPEVEAELKRLRAEKERGAVEYELRAAYEQFLASWDKLQSKLGQLRQTDSGAADRYKAAFAATMGKMTERMG